MEHRDCPDTSLTTGQKNFQHRLERGFSRRLWVYGLGGGLLAGLASGLLGEGVLDSFNPNIGPASIHAPAAEQRGRTALIHAAEINQVALAMGILGGLEGFSLGLAGGLARRSIRTAAQAAAAGLIVGACAALAASFCIMPYYISNRNFFGESFLAPLLLHAALWMPIGATGGLALGFSLGGCGRTAHAVVGGLAGAALGTLLNEFTRVALFPLSNASQPFSETGTSRMTARLLVTLFSAMFALASLPTTTSEEAGGPPSYP
jgi:hypothetical protein